MSDWNTSIIEEFRANEGKVGGQFEDAFLILIHHIGAKSGTERVTPVGCLPRPDGRFAIIASDGGAPANPGLVLQPESPHGDQRRIRRRDLRGRGALLHLGCCRVRAVDNCADYIGDRIKIVQF